MGAHRANPGVEEQSLECFFSDDASDFSRGRMSRKDSHLMAKNKSFPKVGLDSQLLYERLIKAVPGDLISYEELSEIVGRNVQTDAYSSLRTARNRARSQDRIVFAAIDNVGLKCLEDEGLVDRAGKAIQSARNKMRNGIKDMSCIQNYDTLSDSQKVRHNAFGAILLLGNRITAPRKIKALEGMVSQKMQKLTLRQTIEFFAKK